MGAAEQGQVPSPWAVALHQKKLHLVSFLKQLSIKKKILTTNISSFLLPSKIPQASLTESILLGSTHVKVGPFATEIINANTCIVLKSVCLPPESASHHAS